jgi:hypothetical protein
VATRLAFKPLNARTLLIADLRNYLLNSSEDIAMRSWKMQLVAVAVLAWPLTSDTFAQRGERRGGDGRSGERGGGPSLSGNRGGDRGGGGGRSSNRGESFSGNRGGNWGGRSFSGGERPGSGRTSRSYSASPNRIEERTQGSSRPFESGQYSRRRQSGDAGRTQQQSFYRGAETQQFNRQQVEDQDFNPQFDRGARQSTRDSDRTWAGGRNQFNRDQIDSNAREEFRQNDRDGRSRSRSNWVDQQFRDRDRFTDRGQDSWDQDWNNRDGRRDDWSRYGQDDWRWRGNDVRRDWWRGFAGASIPFRYGWWENYYGSSWPVYSPWRFSRWRNQPYYWWGYTPATRLTNWFVFNWDRPRYWAYGPGADIYYRDNYVYYDDQPTVTVDNYYQQIYDLAHSVPKISEQEAERMDWAPLGVFAAMRQNESESQRALQLAVNRDGVLTGTYLNRSNGHVHPVSGMVDERTQRAAWAFADGHHQDVVFETGIYNLTRDEASMMVHFGPAAEATEVWQLVRLDQPEDSRGAATTQSTATAGQSLP